MRCTLAGQAGDIFPTVVAGVMGSDWVFEGDQTLNFTVSGGYLVSAPDLTPPSTTGGEWTETPAYDEGTGLTTFTDTQASFGAFMHGWVLMPNVEQPSYLTIFGVPPGGQTLVVQGDASYSSIATVGATYRVIAPAGIQRNTGALANIGSEGEVTWNPHDRGPSNLWAGYRHVPAMAGWYDEGETTTNSAQSGWNLNGTYHCWNRQYDPWTGRWTTPDPARSPWTSLVTYARSPMTATDPTGARPAGENSGNAHQRQKADEEAAEAFAKAKNERGMAKVGGAPAKPKADCEELEIEVATIADPNNPNQHSDATDKSAESYAGSDNTASTAAEAYEILKKAVDGSTKECACIKRLKLQGHCGRGLGGGQVDDGYHEKIADLLCPDAIIENYHCFAADMDSIENRTIARLLAKKGGVYYGWTGEWYWHPWFPGLGPLWNDGVKKRYEINEGDTDSDLRERYGDGKGSSKKSGDKGNHGEKASKE